MKGSGGKRIIMIVNNFMLQPLERETIIESVDEEKSENHRLVIDRALPELQYCIRLYLALIGERGTRSVCKYEC